MKFDFDSRETYLAQAAAWKAGYAAHAQRIRDIRKAFREAQSACDKGAGSSLAVERLRGERAVLRNTATTMLCERAASKQEAARQWAARRAFAMATGMAT